MEVAYFILLFFYVAVLADGKHFRNDYNYHYPAVEGWFKMHVVPATWFDAYLQCHNEGAVLASPENRHMLHAMKHILAATKTASAVFTGVHATYSNGNYHTVEGTAFSEIERFISWERNEPDNRNNAEDTLILLPNGTMADVPSTNLLPFICFKRRTNFVPTECGTTDPAYTLDSRTGSCYKFHQEPKSWSRAFSVCSGEGGYLAIVNSETEAQVLKGLYAKAPEIQGNSWPDLAFVGFRDFHEQGFFLTVHGQSLQEAGYDAWTENVVHYKLSYNPEYYCGTIGRDGKLAATKCEYKIVFICEKNPDSLMSEEEKYIIINNHENYE